MENPSIANGDVSFCRRPSVRSVPENNPRNFSSWFLPNIQQFSVWDDHFRKYDWGVSGIMPDEVSINRNEWTTRRREPSSTLRRTVASAKYHGRNKYLIN